MVTAAATPGSEYVARVEVINELRFLRQVKAFVILPMHRENAVYEDNKGVIKKVKKRFSSRRTRHIDVKHHIVRDTLDEGVAKINCVKSGLQHANALTNPVGVKSFETHREFFLNVDV